MALILAQCSDGLTVLGWTGSGCQSAISRPRPAGTGRMLTVEGNCAAAFSIPLSEPSLNVVLKGRKELPRWC